MILITWINCSTSGFTRSNIEWQGNYREMRSKLIHCVCVKKRPAGTTHVVNKLADIHGPPLGSTRIHYLQLHADHVWTDHQSLYRLQFWDNNCPTNEIVLIHNKYVWKLQVYVSPGRRGQWTRHAHPNWISAMLGETLFIIIIIINRVCLYEDK